MKTYASAKAIISRETRNGTVYRVLECGHELTEPRGNNSPYATHSRCARCNSTPAAPVLGECTAIVQPLYEKKARACGQPAKFIKRGMPRCAVHFHRGAK